MCFPMQGKKTSKKDVKYSFLGNGFLVEFAKPGRLAAKAFGWPRMQGSGPCDAGSNPARATTSNAF